MPAADSQAFQWTNAVRIANTRPRKLTVDLEPWGESFEMPPGAVFELVANGPADGELQVEIGEERILVLGWPGSIVGILHDTEELGDRLRPRVPRLDGQSAPPPRRAVHSSRYSGEGG